MASSCEIFRIVFRGPFRNRLVALITVVARLNVFMAFMARPNPALPAPDFTVSLSFGDVSVKEKWFFLSDCKHLGDYMVNFSS